MSPASAAPLRLVGRYALFDEIGSGGMATVRLGKLLGPAGFAPVVAIKCPHPGLCKDTAFVSMFLDEARLAARIRHPNVVPVLDVVVTDGELFLVMEYVHGIALSNLQQARPCVPPEIACSVICGTLEGLHAAHEAKNELGEPLGIVHRDVSPQNVLVGFDGIARVLDFGIAKARGRAQVTTDGKVKGKLGYIAPEQLRGEFVNRQADIYAAGVILWELLSGRRLFRGQDVGALMNKVLFAEVQPPSHFVRDLPRGLDAVVMRALARERSERYATAREFALAVQRCVPSAPAPKVGEWVEAHAEDVTRQRTELVARIERSTYPSPAAERGEISIPATTQPSKAANAAIDTISFASTSGDTPGSTVPKKKRRVRHRGRLVVIGALSFAVATSLLLLRAKNTPSPQAGVASSAAVTTAIPKTEPVPQHEAAAVPTQPTPDRPASAPSVSAVPEKPKRLAPRRPTRRRAKQRRTNGQCNPPYTRDAEGRKIYKLQCL